MSETGAIQTEKEETRLHPLIIIINERTDSLACLVTFIPSKPLIKGTPTPTPQNPNFLASCRGPAVDPTLSPSLLVSLVLSLTVVIYPSGHTSDSSGFFCLFLAVGRYLHVIALLSLVPIS